VVGAGRDGDFDARLRALLARLSDLLPNDARGAATRLVEHNEAGEALLVIAHVIVDEGIQVPLPVIREVRDLGDGLVGDEWPQGFDSHAS
jgi:hypothetical protein